MLMALWCGVDAYPLGIGLRLPSLFRWVTGPSLDTKDCHLVTVWVTLKPITVNIHMSLPVT